MTNTVYKQWIKLFQESTIVYTLSINFKIKTFQKKRKHNIRRRSHEGPVLELSRHGSHGCAVDPRLDSQIRLSWFPIKTFERAGNRLDFHPGPRSIVDSSFENLRESVEVIDEARERRVDRSIERFSRGTQTAGNRFARVIARRKPRNERVIPTNRFQPPTEAWRFSEKRRGILSNMQRRACVRGWLHPYGKGPEG